MCILQHSLFFPSVNQQGDGFDYGWLIGVIQPSEQLLLYCAALSFYTSLLFILGVCVFSTYIFEEGVGFGCVFHCTTGLADQFRKRRVFKAPLREQVLPCLLVLLFPFISSCPS